MLWKRPKRVGAASDDLPGRDFRLQRGELTIRPRPSEFVYNRRRRKLRPLPRFWDKSQSYQKPRHTPHGFQLTALEQTVRHFGREHNGFFTRKTRMRPPQSICSCNKYYGISSSSRRRKSGDKQARNSSAEPDQFAEYRLQANGKAFCIAERGPGHLRPQTPANLREAVPIAR
jgi:hypothetical protein